MLVDTGCSQTVLSYASYLAIPEYKRPRLDPPNLNIMMANGDPLKTWGTAWVEVEIGKVCQTLNFVVSDIQVSGILGMDFLLATGSSLDFTSLQLMIRGEKIKCKSAKGEVFCARLVASETTVIPAGHEALIMAEVKDQGWKGKSLGLVEPNDKSQLCEQDIMVAHSIVDTNNLVCVQVCNIGKQRRIVPGGTVIANMTPVDLCDIHTSAQLAVATGEEKEIETERDTEYSELVPDHLKAIYTESVKCIPEENHMQVQKLLTTYADVFSKSDDDIGRTNLVKHDIDTGDARPVKQRSRRMPLVHQEEIDKQVKDLLNRGLISPSNSPWSSQVTLALKKNGQYRLCVDLRRVNALTKKDSYPLPRIDQSIDALEGASWFCTLDLASGYWQVEMSEGAREKTAFAVKGGLYTWNVMPFGLCNAPSTFERLMERVLTGLHWETLLVYLDDVIVWGRNVPEMVARLETVLQRLRAAGLKLKPSKCHLFQKEVMYLGHVVSEKGVHTDPEKVQTVKNWPIPTCVRDVRSFLGLVGYYRKFIEGFSKIAKPLFRLTEKSVKFEWEENCEAAFQKLKNCLISAPILAYPRVEGQYILDCDASAFAIGGVLSQEQGDNVRVIAYGSKTLSKPERNYCVTRRELLAVVYFLKQYRHYVYGRKVLVRSDHGALRWLINFRNPEGQLARWLEVLSSYDMEIVYRPGIKHNNADALSRRPCNQCGREDEQTDQITDMPSDDRKAVASRITCAPSDEPWLSSNMRVRPITVTPVISLQGIRDAQLADPGMSKLLTALENNAPKPKWEEISPCVPDLKIYCHQWDLLCVREGVLCRKWVAVNGSEVKYKILLPQRLRKTVLEHCHGSKAAGHLGQKKTLNKLQDKYYWVRMMEDVRSWLRQCAGCAKRKNPPKKRRAQLRQYQVGGPLERVAIDILGPLPETHNGNKYILVIGDYFSKWMEAIPLPNQTAETVATAFVGEFVCRFGMPMELHSDRGSNFLSRVFKESLKLLGIDQTSTCAYNPKSDGMVERYNRTLLCLVSLFIEPNRSQRDWDDQLPFVGYAYRSAVQESTGETPNMLMLGREVGTPLDLMVENVQEDKETTDYALALRERMRLAHERARKVLNTSARRQKRNYDRRSHGSEIQEGTFVWLHNNQRKVGLSTKLRLPWEGPELVVNKLSDVHCKIQKSPKSKCKIVHMDRLKPYEGPPLKVWSYNGNTGNNSTTEPLLVVSENEIIDDGPSPVEKVLNNKDGQELMTGDSDVDKIVLCETAKETDMKKTLTREIALQNEVDSPPTTGEPEKIISEQKEKISGNRRNPPRQRKLPKRYDI